MDDYIRTSRGTVLLSDAARRNQRLLDLFKISTDKYPRRADSNSRLSRPRESDVVNRRKITARPKSMYDIGARLDIDSKKASKTAEFHGGGVSDNKNGDVILGRRKLKTAFSEHREKPIETNEANIGLVREKSTGRIDLRSSGDVSFTGIPGFHGKPILHNRDEVRETKSLSEPGKQPRSSVGKNSMVPAPGLCPVVDNERRHSIGGRLQRYLDAQEEYRRCVTPDFSHRVGFCAFTHSGGAAQSEIGPERMRANFDQLSPVVTTNKDIEVDKNIELHSAHADQMEIQKIIRPYSLETGIKNNGLNRPLSKGRDDNGREKAECKLDGAENSKLKNDNELQPAADSSSDVILQRRGDSEIIIANNNMLLIDSMLSELAKFNRGQSSTDSEALEYEELIGKEGDKEKSSTEYAGQDKSQLKEVELKEYKDGFAQNVDAITASNNTETLKQKESRENTTMGTCSKRCAEGKYASFEINYEDLAKSTRAFKDNQLIACSNSDKTDVRISNVDKLNCVKSLSDDLKAVQKCDEVQINQFEGGKYDNGNAFTTKYNNKERTSFSSNDNVNIALSETKFDVAKSEMSTKDPIVGFANTDYQSPGDASVKASSPADGINSSFLSKSIDQQSFVCPRTAGNSELEGNVPHRSQEVVRLDPVTSNKFGLHSEIDSTHQNCIVNSTGSDAMGFVSTPLQWGVSDVAVASSKSRELGGTVQEAALEESFTKAASSHETEKVAAENNDSSDINSRFDCIPNVYRVGRLAQRSLDRKDIAENALSGERDVAASDSLHTQETAGNLLSCSAVDDQSSLQQVASGSIPGYPVNYSSGIGHVLQGALGDESGIRKKLPFAMVRSLSANDIGRTVDNCSNTKIIQSFNESFHNKRKTKEDVLGPSIKITSESNEARSGEIDRYDGFNPVPILPSNETMCQDGEKLVIERGNENMEKDNVDSFDARFARLYWKIRQYSLGSLKNKADREEKLRSLSVSLDPETIARKLKRQYILSEKKSIDDNLLLSSATYDAREVSKLQSQTRNTMKLEDAHMESIIDPEQFCEKGLTHEDAGSFQEEIGSGQKEIASVQEDIRDKELSEKGNVSKCGMIEPRNWEEHDTFQREASCEEDYRFDFNKEKIENSSETDRRRDIVKHNEVIDKEEENTESSKESGIELYLENGDEDMISHRERIRDRIWKRNNRSANGGECMPSRRRWESEEDLGLKNNGKINEAEVQSESCVIATETIDEVSQRGQRKMIPQFEPEDYKREEDVISGNFGKCYENMQTADNRRDPIVANDQAVRNIASEMVIKGELENYTSRHDIVTHEENSLDKKRLPDDKHLDGEADRGEQEGIGDAWKRRPRRFIQTNDENNLREGKEDNLKSSNSHDLTITDNDKKKENWQFSTDSGNAVGNGEKMIEDEGSTVEYKKRLRKPRYTELCFDDEGKWKESRVLHNEMDDICSCVDTSIKQEAAGDYLKTRLFNKQGIEERNKITFADNDEVTCNKVRRFDDEESSKDLRRHGFSSIGEHQRDGVTVAEEKPKSSPSCNENEASDDREISNDGELADSDRRRFRRSKLFEVSDEAEKTINNGYCSNADRTENSTCNKQEAVGETELTGSYRRRFRRSRCFEATIEDGKKQAEEESAPVVSRGTFGGAKQDSFENKNLPESYRRRLRRSGCFEAGSEDEIRKDGSCDASVDTNGNRNVQKLDNIVRDEELIDGNRRRSRRLRIYENEAEDDEQTEKQHEATSNENSKALEIQYLKGHRIAESSRRQCRGSRYLKTGSEDGSIEEKLQETSMEGIETLKENNTTLVEIADLTDCCKGRFKGSNELMTGYEGKPACENRQESNIDKDESSLDNKLVANIGLESNKSHRNRLKRSMHIDASPEDNLKIDEKVNMNEEDSRDNEPENASMYRVGIAERNLYPRRIGSDNAEFGRKSHLESKSDKVLSISSDYTRKGDALVQYRNEIDEHVPQRGDSTSFEYVEGINKREIGNRDVRDGSMVDREDRSDECEKRTNSDEEQLSDSNTSRFRESSGLEANYEDGIRALVGKAHISIDKKITNQDLHETDEEGFNEKYRRQARLLRRSETSSGGERRSEDRNKSDTMDNEGIEHVEKRARSYRRRSRRLDSFESSVEVDKDATKECIWKKAAIQEQKDSIVSEHKGSSYYGAGGTEDVTFRRSRRGRSRMLDEECKKEECKETSDVIKYEDPDDKDVVRHEIQDSTERTVVAERKSIQTEVATAEGGKQEEEGMNLCVSLRDFTAKLDHEISPCEILMYSIEDGYKSNASDECQLIEKHISSIKLDEFFERHTDRGDSLQQYVGAKEDSKGQEVKNMSTSYRKTVTDEECYTPTSANSSNIEQDQKQSVRSKAAGPLEITNSSSSQIAPLTDRVSGKIADTNNVPGTDQGIAAIGKDSFTRCEQKRSNDEIGSRDLEPMVSGTSLKASDCRVTVGNIAQEQLEYDERPEETELTDVDKKVGSQVSSLTSEKNNNTLRVDSVDRKLEQINERQTAENVKSTDEDSCDGYYINHIEDSLNGSIIRGEFVDFEDYKPRYPAGVLSQTRTSNATDFDSYESKMHKIKAKMRRLVDRNIEMEGRIEYGGREADVCEDKQWEYFLKQNKLLQLAVSKLWQKEGFDSSRLIQDEENSVYLTGYGSNRKW